MIPVYQTKTVHIDGSGNCFNACIASLLELRLRDLPQILPSDPGDWHERWAAHLADFGVDIVYHGAHTVPQGWAMASVMTNRTFPEDHPKAGKHIAHSVIVFNGKVIHDPFPGGSEITSINHYSTLVPLTETEKKIHTLKAQEGFCYHGYKSECDHPDCKNDSIG